MSNIFAEMQLETLYQEHTVSEARQDMNEIVKIFKSRDFFMQELQWFADFRHLDVQTLLDADAFMVQPDTPSIVLPEHLRHDSLGFCRDNRLVYDGRFVYPVKDIDGNVMGWCGYDKFSDIKYLDSTNYGYKAKFASWWGLETFDEAANDPKRSLFFTEGIVCALYLRQNGFSAYALLGSHITPIVGQMLNWFGSRVYVIPDADEAGNHLRKQIHYYCPKARILQSRVAKDLDDSRQIEPEIIKEIQKIDGHPFYRSPMFC